MSARDEAEALVAAGLCLGRVVTPAGEELSGRVGPWLVATIAERFTLPPAGVVADLGGLLFGLPLRTSLALPTDDPALVAAVRRYEDGVLGRLAVDGRLAAAGDAVARLPVDLHAQAVGILVASVLARIDPEGGRPVEPGIVRKLTTQNPGDTLTRGYALLREDAALRLELATAYAALARGAQKARSLLGEEDLFALENLTVLRTLTQRLAINDVLRAEEAIGAGIPPRIARRRRPDGDVTSRLEDESVYPVGGFASVSTSGSLENLVTSELIYMDPPQPAGTQAPVDLFDMRYVEGELLYYTRDEAIIVRRRRVVVLALASDLVRARVKDVGLPWQRIVLVLGAVLALVRKLALLLGEEALLVRVVFLAEPDGKTPLAEERALTELMLREWIDRGIASVEVTAWDALDLVTASKRALVGVAVFRAQPFALPKLDPRIVVTDAVAPSESVEAWSRAVVELLTALL